MGFTKADEKQLTDRIDELEAALKVSTTAFISRFEDHFPTVMVETPVEWELDLDRNDYCDGKALIAKLLEIQGADLSFKPDTK